MRRLRRLVRPHPWRVASVLAAGAALSVFGVVYFAPQDLLINTSVNEPLPTSSAAPAPRAHEPAARQAAVRSGRFSSGEHRTTGTALLLRLADGRAFVRLQNLSTSNGPAVRVELSGASAPASDTAVARARRVDLGGLKANHGNQNYAVPRGTRLLRYRSVVIWCERFSVVFGSAPLTR